MAFLKKIDLFLINYFFLSKQNQKETIFDILDRKKYFLDLKSKLLKKLKAIDILQRGESMIFVQKSTFFSYLFLEQKKPERKIF